MAHSVREIMNAIRWKWAALFFFMPSYFVRHFTVFNDMTHLSRDTNDLKHKGSQILTPFSSTVFHLLSHSVIHFVPTSIAYQKLPFLLCLKLKAQDGSFPVKRREKLSLKMMLVFMYIFVWGHFCFWKDVKDNILPYAH